MQSDVQERADARLEAALEATGARDPRDRFRGILRELKSRSEEGYARAVDRWQTEVVSPLAEGDGDPLQRWLTFGVAMARELHPGRTVEVDPTGRAAPFEGPPSWEALILHLPEQRNVKALTVNLPPEPTPAQQATVALLVEGRNRLPDG